MQILFSTPLLLLGTVYALPSIQHQHHTISNATWEFSVYQNDHCTGEITLFSGTRSTTCRDGILNGGAFSYIPDKITDSHCRNTALRSGFLWRIGGDVGFHIYEYVPCSPLSTEATSSTQ
ncbi:hypothetical protein BDV40DRAFT_293032 [Aspergillus tamarii]|uniref:Uncharacterized protein n=1 Tax=Aspergillus tamarii TaxID=41984 RepID=A0A5N6UFP9_ASPTM|nr:hypothetical protein BDV40DRAFT_293032 [Aspergillus tamarii]